MQGKGIYYLEYFFLNATRLNLIKGMIFVATMTLKFEEHKGKITYENLAS